MVKISAHNGRRLQTVSHWPEILNMATKRQRRKRRGSHSLHGPLHGSSSPCNALSQRGLWDPIKPTYNRSRVDGWLKLTATAFKQLAKTICQQSWSQDLLLCRTRYGFHYTFVPIHAGMARLSCPGLVNHRGGLPVQKPSSISVLTGFNAE